MAATDFQMTHQPARNGNDRNSRQSAQEASQDFPAPDLADPAVNHEDPELSSLPVFAPLHVLVVDDSAANRAFAVSLLEHRGHSWKLASTGLEAIELYLRYSFDAVLMDLEMPNLDGVGATEIIRSLPRGKDVPIIAMTTQTAEADREKCRNAGMTEFVSKPFSARDMVIILERAVARVRLARISRLLHVLPERTPMAPTSSPSAAAVVNLGISLQRLGNDQQLLRDMAGFYIEDVPELMGELRSALEADDVELATRSAHSLKGLSSNFEATFAIGAAMAVETAARSGDLAKAAGGVDELDYELGRVIEALKAQVLGH
ncbi:Signal transduction histidine-protein kinase BarA [Caulifigura coniformis]|uniref:Signal transduction histidine-protein kinase BarA n=1 Tax=Caulifigura coniformis TaxID=2527983 RepID=A0A517SC35_9PLAN|nr:response regulator [Caulifigura coniformis]QDT53673.1 Signal transduction histidine-protein kinase BarA [Caulifigura coniformis]